jgi:type II secretory pathway pseudopilin PulG
LSNLQSSRIRLRRRQAALTLMEMLLVIAIVAGLSSALMWPAWKAWKGLALKQQQKQLHEFFQGASMLMRLSKADLKLELGQYEGKEQLTASGYFLEARLEKISIMLEKGFHLSIEGKNSGIWLLSNYVFEQNVSLHLEDEAHRSVSWQESLCLWEKL